MALFPNRAPVGFLLGAVSALAAAPALFALWHHSQSPLEAVYFSQYIQASVLPSHRPLSGTSIIHSYYLVTVNGKYATPETLPSDMQHVSGRFAEMPPSMFAAWLKATIYHGQSIWELLAVPALLWAACGVALLIAGGLFDFRRRQKAREGEQLRGPETLTIAQFNRTTKQKEKGFVLQTK